MKKKNKHLVLTLALSSLLLVGCAANPEAKTAHTPTNNVKLAMLTEGTLPSLSVPDTQVQPIDEASAKTAALVHADVNDSDVSFVKVNLDRENGRHVYEVEFYDANYTEYDYEIDALTGEVLDFDRDAEDFAPPVKEETKTEISKQQALEIVVSQVPGATTDHIRELETDHDDGRLTYEGSLHYNHVEYEFEIDGTNGTILSWEIED